MYDSFEGTTTVTKQYKFEIKSIAIANDGEKDITLDLGYCKVTVKPNEIFDESIVLNQAFTINANGPYRCIVRGDG